MSHTRRFAVLFVWASVGVASAFGAPKSADLQSAFNALAGDFLGSLPLNAQIGLDWSDACIGTWPHFGVGLSIGLASTPSGPLKDFCKTVNGGDLPAAARITSGWTIDARIGGFGIPFDIGLKIGGFPAFLSDKLDQYSEGLNILHAGFDLRFLVVKERRVVPAVSVGAAYNFLMGEMTLKPAKLSWSSHLVEVRAQVSKSFLVATPFLGVALGLSWSNLDCTVSDVPDAPKGNFSTGASVANSLYGRVFLGGSFNLALIKINAAVTLGFPTFGWGVSIGVRFQR
jgi:hypothetical protein